MIPVSGADRELLPPRDRVDDGTATARDDGTLTRSMQHENTISDYQLANIVTNSISGRHIVDQWLTSGAEEMRRAAI